MYPRWEQGRGVWVADSLSPPDHSATDARAKSALERLLSEPYFNGAALLAREVKRREAPAQVPAWNVLKLGTVPASKGQAAPCRVHVAPD